VEPDDGEQYQVPAVLVPSVLVPAALLVTVVATAP
jgi:hypothetical protein